jgi:hypothetical protein
MSLRLRRTSSRGLVRPLTIALASIAFATLACSSTATSSPAPRGTLAQADVAAFVAARCERMSRCDPQQLFQDFGDVAGCSTLLVPDTDDEVNGPGTSVTKAQIDACVAKLKTVPCGATAAELPECNFAGTLADGTSCLTDSQCKSGSCGRPDVQDLVVSCGTCSPPVALGGDCSAANCQLGLGCVQGKCVAPVDPDAACDESKPCKGVNQCFQGKCTAPLAKGAECVANDETALVCDPIAPLTCISTSTDKGAKGTCVPIVFAKPNEPCGLDQKSGSLILCATSTCDQGKCQPDLPEGAPCSDAQPTICAFSLTCKDGKCIKEAAPACP